MVSSANAPVVVSLERPTDAPEALFLHRLDRVVEATDPFAVPDEVLDALDDETHVQISERFGALQVNGWVWACKVDDAQVRRYGTQANPGIKAHAARIGVSVRHVYQRAAVYRRLLAPRHGATGCTLWREADILNSLKYWLLVLDCHDPDLAIEEMLRHKADHPGFNTSAARRLVGHLNAAQRQAGPLDENGPAIALASWEQWLSAQAPCDLLLTDPPYSTDVEDIAAFAASWLPPALAKVKPTGRAYVFIGAYAEELEAYLAVSGRVGWEPQLLVWTYRNTLGPAPRDGYKLNWQAILYFTGPRRRPCAAPISSSSSACRR